MVNKIYRIVDWEKLYENNRTRELKNLQWVLIPNKQDGDGYTALMDHENGPAHFGAWVAILQIASKCEPRGTLLRGCGKPHTPETIGRMSHLPAGLCRDALDRLTSDEIAWMEVVDESVVYSDLGSIPQQGAGLCDAYQNGTERNRREKNRKESAKSAADKPSFEDEDQIGKMQMALLAEHPEWKMPDREIAVKCLKAAGGRRLGEVQTAIAHFRGDGKTASVSWGWYPTMLAKYFRTERTES